MKTTNIKIKAIQNINKTKIALNLTDPKLLNGIYNIWMLYFINLTKQTLTHTYRPTWWTWFHQVQHVNGSTSLLILEQHYNQPIRFEGQGYTLCQV